jgi:hypothetical protein
MTARSMGYLVAGIAMVAVLCIFLVSEPSAQNRGGVNAATAAAQAKPTPRLSNGHPDMTGFYGSTAEPVEVFKVGHAVANGVAHDLTRTDDGSLFFDYAGADAAVGHNLGDADQVVQAPNQPPYKPEYMAKVKKIADTVYGSITHLDPWLECKPAGVPRAGIGGSIQIVQSPKATAILYENNPGPQYRIIYTDGRQHPPDLDTSYMGDSIGHWEGDTLVVDTIGLNDETWYTQTGGANALTSIHSDKEHVIERFTRKGDDLAYEAVVEDPVMLTRPWVLPVRHTRIGNAKDYIQPEMCNTNDKDHIIEPSATDKFVCDFCQKDADKFYGPGGGDRDRQLQQEKQKKDANAPGAGAPE